MAIAILKSWQSYFDVDRDEGLGSSYERVILNRVLENLCKRYAVETVLEAPCFGFTGLSGINSLGLAKAGVSVSLLDHDQERLKRIRAVWSEVGQQVKAQYVPDYDTVPFASRAFDMSWNFAAMWFVADLSHFAAELTRVTSKVIVIGVPNRTGLGYWLEKLAAGVDVGAVVREENIVPRNIVRAMARCGWKLVSYEYIDAPPWPDIGMKKEDFLRFFRLDRWFASRPSAELPRARTVMDYYTGADPGFEREMLRYAWWERLAPRPIKFFWAHHRMLRFEPRDA